MTKFRFYFFVKSREQTKINVCILYIFLTKICVVRISLEITKTKNSQEDQNLIGCSYGIMFYF